MDHYLHVQDFVDAYIGPFPSHQAALDHYNWTKNVRGDGADMIAISTDLPPAGEFVITMEADFAWSPDDPGTM